jgi:hypothetical protein
LNASLRLGRIRVPGADAGEKTGTCILYLELESTLFAGPQFVTLFDRGEGLFFNRQGTKEESVACRGDAQLGEKGIVVGVEGGGVLLFVSNLPDGADACHRVDAKISSDTLQSREKQ